MKIQVKKKQTKVIISPKYERYDFLITKVSAIITVSMLLFGYLYGFHDSVALLVVLFGDFFFPPGLILMIRKLFKFPRFVYSPLEGILKLRGEEFIIQQGDYIQLERRNIAKYNEMKNYYYRTESYDEYTVENSKLIGYTFSYKRIWNINLVSGNDTIILFEFNDNWLIANAQFLLDTYAEKLAIALEIPFEDLTGIQPIMRQAGDVDLNFESYNTKSKFVEKPTLYKKYQVIKEDKYTIIRPRDDLIDDGLTTEAYLNVFGMVFLGLFWIAGGIMFLINEIALVTFIFVIPTFFTFKYAHILYKREVEFRFVKEYGLFISSDKIILKFTNTFDSQQLMTINRQELEKIIIVPSLIFQEMMPAIDGVFKVWHFPSEHDDTVTSSGWKYSSAEIKKHLQVYQTMDELAEKETNYYIEFVAHDKRFQFYTPFNLREAESLVEMIEWLLLHDKNEVISEIIQ